jgi:hypothetical protein
LEERCMYQLIFQNVEGVLLFLSPTKRHSLLCRLI